MIMRIKELRVAAGMTQGELAAGMGVNQNTISQWEHEVVLPRTRQLPELARLLGVNFNELFANADTEAGYGEERRHRDPQGHPQPGPVDTGALKRGIIREGERSRKKGKKVYKMMFDPTMNDVFQKPIKHPGAAGGSKKTDHAYPEVWH